jgi:hypothetical protein
MEEGPICCGVFRNASSCYLLGTSVLHTDMILQYLSKAKCEAVICGVEPLDEGSV